MATVAASDTADRCFAGQDWLAPPDDRRAVVEHKAAELAAQPTLLLGQQRRATNEVTLVQLDAEAQASLVWRIFGRQLGAPVAVALLEAQRIDAVVPAGRHAKWLPGIPEGIPHMQ